MRLRGDVGQEVGDVGEFWFLGAQKAQERNRIGVDIAIAVTIAVAVAITNARSGVESMLLKEWKGRWVHGQLEQQSGCESVQNLDSVPRKEWMGKQKQGSNKRRTAGLEWDESEGTTGS